ncbi:P-loop containing nucleoside triphosphate hydrolase protein [Thamnidium elegans]|nr:P-loop containing nucleoside triphosphate hydrolase protein [Thamnidium elegans]
MPKPLIVQFTPIRSCLVNLPSKWVNALLDQNKVKVIFWRLQDGQKVNVEFCRNVTECTTVSVEPLTEDDWEILELHAGYVEEHLLSQIRVVYTDQIMCVWIHGKTLVRLVVAELDPKQDHLKLTNRSEVIVAPKVRKKEQEVVETDLNSDKKVAVKVQPSIGLRTCPLVVKDLEVHIHPDSVGVLVYNGIVPDRVRLTKLVPVFLSQNRHRSSAEEEGQPEEVNEEGLFAKAVFAQLVLSTTVPLKHVAIGSVLKNTLEIKDFDIIKVSTIAIKQNQVGPIILKRFINPTNSNNIKLGLESSQQQKTTFETECTKMMQDWLCNQRDGFVLSQGIMIELTVEEKKEQFLVQLGSKKGLFSSAQVNIETEQFIVITAKDKAVIEFGDPIQRVSAATTVTVTEPTVMGGVDKVFEKIQQYTLANLSERDLKNTLCVPGSGGVLVTGSHGSGKTSLVHTILKDIKKSNIYTMEINCSELADERIPVFKDKLLNWFDEAAWHGPSLIFFDDLDRLIPAEVEHADSTRSRHLAELFVRVALTACQRHPIMLMATAQQQQSLHPALITHHIFSELNHLQPPGRDERKLIMQAIMSHGPDVLTKSLPLIDLVSVASETEGFLAADIKAFIERTVHEGAVRSIKKKMEDNDNEQQEFTLMQEDFSKAREGFVPSSLRGIKLQSSGVNWSDIGGLNETRKALLETLEWPTKYAAVFAQCPLRLRSGVKGPEILNKYIGASEKSVRDLFERAQAAKPCVLFFDEFDSIAPRRGHDSTGVTDRVVNQMLTQMDGAEGLDGVYVLAATSRPDLIDPALLRPGRLDKALLCGLPSISERLEILEALALKMKLGPDVDLKVYAEKTEGFSGADLQGFLYNAHLEAIHGAIDMDSFKQAQDNKSNDKSSNEKSDFVTNRDGKVPLTLAEKGQISQRLAMIKKGVKDGNSTSSSSKENKEVIHQQEANITRAHLEKSLKSTRPSITAEESYRLGLIYNEFVTGRTGELPSGEGEKGVGKRSTLG